MRTHTHASTDTFHVYLIFIYLFTWHIYNNMVISRVPFPFEKECRLTKESDTEVSVILRYHATSLSISWRTFLGNAVVSSPRLDTSKNIFGHIAPTLSRNSDNRITRDAASYPTKTETSSSPLRNHSNVECHILS
jgi:hypothetical protein